MSEFLACVGLEKCLRAARIPWRCVGDVRRDWVCVSAPCTTIVTSRCSGRDPATRALTGVLRPNWAWSSEVATNRSASQEEMRNLHELDEGVPASLQTHTQTWSNLPNKRPTSSGNRWVALENVSLCRPEARSTQVQSCWKSPTRLGRGRRTVRSHLLGAALHRTSSPGPI